MKNIICIWARNGSTHEATFLRRYSASTNAIGLAYSVCDYLKLFDWTRSLIRERKHNGIDYAESLEVSRFGKSPMKWLYLCIEFESRFKGLVGGAHSQKNPWGNFGLSEIRKRAIAKN